jgi:acyl-CoA dehydrogenase
MDDTEMNIGTMLADQLERLFGRTVDLARLVGIEAGEDITDLWEQIDELGAGQAMASGELGAQLSWTECLPMLTVLGRHGAPVPLGETLLAARALSGCGLQVPQGPLAISTGRFELAEDGRISGQDQLVPWLPAASQLVGIAMAGSESQLFTIGAGQLDHEPVSTLARIPSGRLCLARVQPQHLAPVPAALMPGGFGPQLAVLRAAQISGLLQRILALVIDYANTREQFGRPIGKFQAIQHQIAELATHAAAAQAGTAYGCRGLDSGFAEQAGAVAKLRASVAAGHAARIAHQVFGAIGVTEEHELHHLTRRLWQWRQEGGSEHEWSELLGRRLIAAGGSALWPALTGELKLQACVGDH